MFFDDRLATVLRQSATSDATRRTQYRQLLDLLGAQTTGVRKAARDPSLVAAAWMRMNKLAEAIPAKDRARLVTEPGWRLRNPELVAHLADFEPDVASAALTRANLSADDWTTLIPRLPVRARGFLRLRRDLPGDVETMLEQLGIYDRGLPTPEAEYQEMPETLAADAGSNSRSGKAVDLPTRDELPGSNIPEEDLPVEPLVTPPIGPFSGTSDSDSDSDGDSDSDSDGGNQSIKTPSRPIFFPKETAKSRGEPSESEDFTPEPFTIAELREIAEEPLGIDEPSPDASLADEAAPSGDRQEPEPPKVEDSANLSEQILNDQAQIDEPTAESSPDIPADRRSEISALVERISNFQRAKQDAPQIGPDLDGETDFVSSGQVDDAFAQGDRLMPRLPLDERDNARARIVRGFSFAADAAGRIEWAEADVAPMVVGMRLIRPARLQSGTQHSQLVRAFIQRQPIQTAPFTMDGSPSIAGEWVVDAQPRFSQIGGFAGYVGRMRRPIEAAPAGPSPAQREADRIRQLLHELRTPVTAVQGYSEVIQQQLFGSAPHEYRALAAAIASDAARILSGFEELDRLARLETGTMQIDEGQADIGALATRFVRQLAQVLDPRMAAIALEIDSKTPLFATIDPDNAESLMWRLLASLGGGCEAGETLQAKLLLDDGFVRLSCDLPMQLLGEDDLFAADARPTSTAINPGIFGAGFALRLARAEARAAGGNLVRDGEAITLTLPKASEKVRPKSGDQNSDFAAS